MVNTLRERLHKLDQALTDLNAETLDVDICKELRSIGHRTFLDILIDVYVSDKHN